MADNRSSAATRALARYPKPEACQDCGAITEALEAHHVIPYTLLEQLGKANDYRAHIYRWLCAPCHDSQDVHELARPYAPKMVTITATIEAHVYGRLMAYFESLAHEIEPDISYLINSLLDEHVRLKPDNYAFLNADTLEVITHDGRGSLWDYLKDRVTPKPPKSAP